MFQRTGMDGERAVVAIVATRNVANRLLATPKTDGRIAVSIGVLVREPKRVFVRLNVDEAGAIIIDQIAQLDIAGKAACIAIIAVIPRDHAFVVCVHSARIFGTLRKTPRARATPDAHGQFPADNDGDGFGAGVSAEACSVPLWRVATSTDCDGSNNDVVAASCATYYADADADLYGFGAGSCLCSATSTYAVPNATDCNDGDADHVGDGKNPSWALLARFTCSFGHRLRYGRFAGPACGYRREWCAAVNHDTIRLRLPNPA